MRGKLSINSFIKKLFGKNYPYINKRLKLFKNRFKFNLSKKIASQKIVDKESGFILDFTKNNFLTFHLRPKDFHDFNLESTCSIEDKMGIVIQGPIQENFDFLKNTLKIYEKIFKNSLIVISTWESEDINKIKNLINERVHVIFNREPQKSISNIDHQTLSTSAGLDYLHTKKIKYVLKLRADIRLNKNNLESFLTTLIKFFPILKKNETINSRIIVPSINTYKYRLYSLTDIVMFGEISDLINYFDKEPYKIGIKKFNLQKDSILINDTPLVAEIFLCARYLQKIERDLKWDLDNWWISLKNYFCIIDNSSLDLLWFKYEWDYEFKYTRTYSHKFARALDFQDWFSLYNGSKDNWNKASSVHEKYDEKMEIKNLY